MKKLPGMNGSKRKKVVVGMGYAFLVLFIIGIFLPEQPDEVIATPVQETKEVPVVVEVVEEKPKKEPLTIEQQVTNAVFENYGETNGPEDNTIKYHKYDDVTKHLDVGIYSDMELFAVRDVVLSRMMDSVEAMKDIDGVQTIYIQIYYPTNDAYGERTYTEVVRVDLPWESLNKIQFDSFDADQLPNVTTDYWENPILRK